MWCAHKDSPDMIEFLMEHGAELNHENKEGWNALDIAVLRLSYSSAKLLYHNGLWFKDPEAYRGDLRHPYDIDLFIEYVQEDWELETYKIFFKKIEQEQEEWTNKDLVLDPNETWK